MKTAVKTALYILSKLWFLQCWSLAVPTEPQRELNLWPRQQIRWNMFTKWFCLDPSKHRPGSPRPSCSCAPWWQTAAARPSSSSSRPCRSCAAASGSGSGGGAACPLSPDASPAERRSQSGSPSPSSPGRSGWWPGREEDSRTRGRDRN